MIPTTGPDTAGDQGPGAADPRDAAISSRPTYDVPIAVTGFTAVAIDVSDRLGGALLPFGILVVGLSLVLLTMVFRSIAVPLKATVGYLLSVRRRVRRDGHGLRVRLVLRDLQRAPDRAR